MHESPPFEFIPVDGDDDNALAPPDFTPVPLTRRRHDGWTVERQRAFIAALAQTGVVAAAARSVGMGVTSAYTLRRRPGAESFARAWALAETDARRRAYEFILEQALCGTTRPRFYRGRFVSGPRLGHAPRPRRATRRLSAKVR